ncbi:MAG: Asp-tRNA(Asn)/Glu-tRNA(Gln) amidotransferase subunit GatA [Candidatus Omnitrophica bacterium]|nr:Asp-tRNA(Asn)/Glu-tRNA(Gln) amidotransferase subunit GatA [Candidatus Omnitrophota bacterium]
MHSKKSIPNTAKSCLDRISAINEKLNAIIYIDTDKVLKNAQEKPSGIPITIKDNICVKDEPTTCASRILENFKPPYDATVIKKLKDAGFILMGKANMDEFAFGSSCETSCYGPTRNPWDTTRIPGGSSGGSACAVAGGEVPMALGSDTGGSIRQPAALSGIVGMKPTYGRVSRYGLIAFASSLDQIGPLAGNVRDAAMLLNVISGYDELDSTSADVACPDFTQSLENNVRKIKIGVPKEYFPEKGLDGEVKKAILESKDILQGLGAELIDISLPHTEYAVSCYYIIAPAEASSNLARFDGDQYGLRKDAKNMIDMHLKTRTAGFGDEAKRRILLGTYSLSSGYYEAYYLKAMKVRTKIKNDFLEAFKTCDVILTPTTPAPAFKIGEKINDPLGMYLSDIFTIPANLAGIPGISIPCGFTKGGLPIGLQLLGKPFDEETLFRVAYAFEQNTEFHKRKPNI